jgi:hypothetical protein
MNLNLGARSDSGDEAVSYEYGTIFYDSEIGERGTPAGSAAT